MRKWCVILLAIVVAADGSTTLNDIPRLRLAVEELGRTFPGEYPAAEFLRRLDAVSTPAELERCQRAMLVEANPLLKSKKLLFVKRNAYGSYHYYDEHDNGIVRAGMAGIFVCCRWRTARYASWCHSWPVGCLTDTICRLMAGRLCLVTAGRLMMACGCGALMWTVPACGR